MDTNIALLVREGAVKERYEREIKNLGAGVHTVSSFQELYSLLKATPFNGVIIDLLSKIRASQHDKELFIEILENFPVLQFNYDRNADEVRSFSMSRFGDDSSLESFIRRDCVTFSARVARSSARRNIHLNALLSRNGSPAETAEKTVTMDVSVGGCFLFSVRPWAIKDKVSVALKELTDPTPIVCEVRWIQPWGQFKRAPGVGVKFLHIRENQRKAISVLL